MATAKKTARKAPAKRSTPAKKAAAPAAKAAGPKAATERATKKDGKDAASAKVKKPKLVRDSFTIPKAEYAVLDALKARAAKAGKPAKKGELLRAGLKALAGMSDAAFIVALGAVPALKTGRPAKV